ncbi:hypothetical protein Hanom_Chr16g01515461 [Helianthus anomalus]
MLWRNILLNHVSDIKLGEMYACIWKRVKYTNGPCGLPKFWIWSLAFQKYMDGPCSLHFLTHQPTNLKVLACPS